MFEDISNNFDTFAREAIAHVIEIDNNLKTAESEKNIRQQPDESAVQFRAREANAAVKLEKAREAHKDMSFHYYGEVDGKIADMRAELEKAVNDRYAVRPADLDHDVLTLLNSGILSPTEYSRLFDAADNPTMKRIIAHAAGEAAEKLKDDKEGSRVLRNVAAAGTHYNGSEYINAFDGLSDVLRRTVRNPRMAKAYDGLAAPYLNIFHR